MRQSAFQAEPGFTFVQYQRPFEPGELYSLDENPNNITGAWTKT